MKRSGTTAVIGLGLIGGSIARDHAARGGVVLGYDQDPGVLTAALKEGIVHRPLTADFAEVEEADFLILATPVNAALSTLAGLAERISPDTVVTDVGSVKRPFADAAERLGIGNRTVGSHPLAGDHRSGWIASRNLLFDSATVFVCPGPSSSATAIERVEDFWRGLGARPVRLDPATHDERLAWISHLPQVISSALASVLGRAGVTPDQLGPGGRDMTRLAASSPEMWTAIASANADFLLPAIDALQRSLQEFRNAIDTDDLTHLHRLFDEARSWSL